MAEASVDGYMYFVGEGETQDGSTMGKIKGESLDSRFETHGAFKISSFIWQSAHDCATKTNEDEDFTGGLDGLEEKRTRHQLRKVAANRLDATVQVGAFEVTKEVDLATPSLFFAHAHVAKFRGCHVYFRKTGGGKLFTFFHASFSDVLIERWSMNLDTGSRETIVVNFNWCQLHYFPQSSTGTGKKDIANIKAFCRDEPRTETSPPAVLRTSVADVKLETQ